MPQGAYYRADGQIFKHHLYRLRWYDNRQCQAYSRIRSSVREVLPGRAYTIPATQEDKYNPLTVDSKQFVDIISAKPLTVSKAIYSSFSGISPLVANELAHRAGLDADSPVAAYSHDASFCTWEATSHG